MPTRLSRGVQVAPEPTWRCPECRTVQASTARCWRCSKPVHTCESCRLYQPSVAADLGTCADDPTGLLVSARESRSCWRSQMTPSGLTAGPSPDGLFSELEQVATVTSLEPLRPAHAARPERSAPSIRRAPDRVVRTDSEHLRRAAKPDLEDAGRAAWVEPDEDRLVDVPTVEPGERLTTEVQRRRRRWFR